jgi:acyl-CoA reductase-like NAD-dependent aldehyde dehydrogenase
LRGLDVARRVQTGSIGVDRYRLDPGSPFGGVKASGGGVKASGGGVKASGGGIKASGMGRELGPERLATFQQLKSILPLFG